MHHSLLELGRDVVQSRDDRGGHGLGVEVEAWRERRGDHVGGEGAGGRVGDIDASWTRKTEDAHGELYRSDDVEEGWKRGSLSSSLPELVTPTSRFTLNEGGILVFSTILMIVWIDPIAILLHPEHKRRQSSSQ